MQWNSLLLKLATTEQSLLVKNKNKLTLTSTSRQRLREASETDSKGDAQKKYFRRKYSKVTKKPDVLTYETSNFKGRRRKLVRVQPTEQESISRLAETF